MEYNYYETESNSSSGESEDLEAELYSVLHYNSFDKDISPRLLEKYHIHRNNNEFFISMKKPGVQIKEPIQEVSVTPVDKVDNVESSASINNATDETSSSNCSNVIDNNEPTSSENNNVIKPVTVNQPADICNPGKILSEDIIVIDTDSSDSDVIIQEPNWPVAIISSPSEVEVISDSNIEEDEIISDSDIEEDEIMLNTSNPRITFPVDNSVEEEMTFNWREVASPSSWSASMKRYYNKPSKRLKEFDCYKILNEIRGKGTWHINDLDMFPTLNSRRVKRCTLCRQSDHLVKNCPKKFSNCAMCGNPDHNVNSCPNKICFNCGQYTRVFVSMCQKCQNERHKVCGHCKQEGHIQSNCPDTWRKYHSTTTGGTIVTTPDAVNKKIMCCNCGKIGHLYEHCSRLYYSPYPPTSFLVKNKEENPLQILDKQRKRTINNSAKKNWKEERNYASPSEGRQMNTNWSEGKQMNTNWSERRNNLSFSEGRKNSNSNERRNSKRRYFNMELGETPKKGRQRQRQNKKNKNKAENKSPKNNKKKKNKNKKIVNYLNFTV